MANDVSELDAREKVCRISEYVASHTYSSACVRFSNDPLGFFIGGMGRCEKMAHAESFMLNLIGIRSQVVSLVGEDHSFVEVYVAGQWMASDPGYGYHLNTTVERGAARLAEFGGLSFVLVEGTAPPEFVTDRYVLTDTIVIRVLKNGVAYAGGSLLLKHEFRGFQLNPIQVPLDGNGTVILKMGSMQYNSNAGSTDSFYSIWVDDKDVNQTVISYGMNRTVTIAISLTEP